MSGAKKSILREPGHFQRMFTYGTVNDNLSDPTRYMPNRPKVPPACPDAICRIFDVDAWEWIEADTPKPSLEWPSSVIAGRHVFLFGGVADFKKCPIARYDLDHHTWSYIDIDLMVGGRSSGAVLLTPTTALVCGGHRTVYASADRVFTCVEVDLITYAVTPLPDMHEARASHAVVNYNDTIVVIGGIYHRSMYACEQFSPLTKKWTRFPELIFDPYGNTRHSAVVINDKIYTTSCNGISIDCSVFDGTAWSAIKSCGINAPSRPYPYTYAYIFVYRGRPALISNFGAGIVVFDADTDTWYTPPECNEPGVPDPGRTYTLYDMIIHPY